MQEVDLEERRLWIKEDRNIPSTKANTVGTIIHKNWLYVFWQPRQKKKKKRQSEKKKKHNELYNSLIEKKKIYYFLKEGTFFSWY